MSLLPNLDQMTDNEKLAVLESIQKSIAESKEIQKKKIGENVDLVVQALKKIESDIRDRFDAVGNSIEKRVLSIQDGRDGADGKDGRDGKDGKSGKDGLKGDRGVDGQAGRDGVDGVDGISVVNAHIDFDGSLVISLSDGRELNVGEVVSQDIAEKIKVISTMSTNGAIAVKEEGTTITSGVKSLNFVGTGITATTTGDDVTVTVSGGSGTVTSVSALTLGTSGTDLSSTVANSTTTPVITLNVPTASATNRGALSSADWTTFNNKGSGTVTSVAATAGTGISVTGSPITTSGTLTITNTAPDQTVALTQGGTTTITGTYPNFTISSADQYQGTVTSVTGTSPVSSTGGATPAISLAASYGDTQNPYASKTANFVLAAPNGSAGVPTFRAVVAADIPTLNQNTTGSAATVTTTINSGVVATTQTAGDNSTKVATTAYVNAITGTNGITGFKNRIINSAMVIDQRNAGAASSSSISGYFLDRWSVSQATTGKLIAQQNAGSVTPPTGFSNYLGTTSQSAYSVTSTDFFLIFQPIEGFNTSDFAFGTASASTVTLSFWVRSSLTGNFGGAIKNSASNRSYPFSYTISSANTWEQKSVTIAGDTSGTWIGATNGVGLYVAFSLGSGSTRLGTANTWASANYDAPTGSTSVVGTNGATFYITGVQLEKGSTATSFDYRPYGTELALCQRYYAKFSSLSGVYVGFGSGVSTATTSAAIVVKYPVRMRAAPTISQSNSGLYDGGSIVAVTSIGTSYYGDETVFANLNVASGMTLGRGCLWCGANNAAAYIDFSSEL